MTNSLKVLSAFRPLLIVAALCAGACPALASDADAVRAVMMKIWDGPDSRLVVDPVVLSPDYAIAGWSQGEMGGRALLRKKAGAWEVTLCAGDDLKKPDLLMKAGMSHAMAQQLAADLAKSEAALPRERLALFSKFEGLVMVDPAAGHAPHGHSSHGHKP
jgi:hypothetical protein